MSTQFENLGLSKEILQGIADLGFEEASPIQAQAIPLLLTGRDVIGQAQTGTGKTAAFGIPLLEKIDTRSRKTQALVLCPTRELAIQVAAELGHLAAHKPQIMVLPVYGGQPIERQLRGLAKGAQVVVGTPGRILDHLARGSLSLSTLCIAILDEADEMLDMGFRDDMEAILEQSPERCQRVLFSATMPPAILDLAKRFLFEAELVKITQKVLTVPNIEQFYYEVRPHLKMDALCRVLDAHDYRKVLVFCSTKRGVDEVNSFLQTRGYLTDCLHGNLVQGQRDRVMGRFRSGTIEILVATDVAARGIDVDDVEAVINYDIPTDVENYVHRIGRTGRAGKSGSAHTFVAAREHFKLRDIIRYTKARILQSQLPTLRDVNALKINRLLEQVRTVITAGGLEHQIALIEHFLEEDLNPLDVSAALLKLLIQRDLDFSNAQAEDPLHTDKPNSFSGKNNIKKQWRDNAAPFAHKERQKRKIAMTRLFFNVGSKMHVQARDLVGAIAGETGLPGRHIGSIEIHDRFSFVDIPQSMADDVLRVMSGSQIRGYTVAVEKAQQKMYPQAKQE